MDSTEKTKIKKHSEAKVMFNLLKSLLRAVKEVLKKANPFSKYGEDSSVFYIVKKMLAFVAI